ncbi:MAG: type II secretion system protein [Pseudomonadales bacterium]
MKQHPTLMQQAGFSLIEMAVVMVVLGLALGGLLMPLSVQLENSARKETQAEMAVIKEALMGFAMANGRLPCPDTTGDGQENQTLLAPILVCTRTYGDLPSGTLGVGIDDAWNRPYSYLVSADFADTTPGTGCGTVPSSGASFELCSTGNLRVQDRAGNIIAEQLSAVITSHGKHNLVPGRSAFENNNFDTARVPAPAGSNLVRIKDNYSETSGAELDDLIDWLSPAVLQSKMVTAGLLP